MKKTLFFRFIFTLLIILCGVYFLRPRMSMFSFIDYIEYWSAARLVSIGSNPYGFQEVLELQQSIGWPDEKLLHNIPPNYPWIMMNPPMTIAYILPLGLIDYDTSRTIYFLLTIFLFMLSASWLWEALGGTQKRVWIAWIIVFSFGATLQVIRLGQVSILMLVGCALFLRMAQRERWFWAGVASSTILIKPHTLYLLGIALVLWVISTRRWQVLLGLFSGIVGASSLVMILNPSIFSQYLSRMLEDPPTVWLTATPGAMLRITFGWNLFWLQYIPSLLGLIWLAWYWLKTKDDWHWENELPMLTLASTATAAYGWVDDTIVAVPALLGAAILILAIPFGENRRIKLGLLFILLTYAIWNWQWAFSVRMPQDYWWFAGILWLLYSILITSTKIIYRRAFTDCSSVHNHYLH